MHEMKSNKRKSPVAGLGLFLLIFTMAVACHKSYTPKPKGYFRIDFPEKKYVKYESPCGYNFEYPVYGKIVPFQGKDAEPCWINIEFPGYKGKLHLTYKDLKNDLSTHVEDIHTLAYKHIIKADDIIEKPISFPDRNVYGLMYDIRGNTASSLSFWVTDSTRHFLSGALYFSVIPNKDSLAPVIRFFTKDIDHLIETLSWNK
jgi:gliding motility-associated lipoprotein GldD